MKKTFLAVLVLFPATLFAQDLFHSRDRIMTREQVKVEVLTPQNDTLSNMPARYIAYYDTDSLKFSFLINTDMTIEYPLRGRAYGINVGLTNKTNSKMEILWDRALLNGYPVRNVYGEQFAMWADLNRMGSFCLRPKEYHSFCISSSLYRFANRTQPIYAPEDRGNIDFDLYLPVEIIRDSVMYMGNCGDTPTYYTKEVGRDSIEYNIKLRLRKPTRQEVNKVLKEKRYWHRKSRRVRLGMTRERVREIMGEPRSESEDKHEMFYPHVIIYFTFKGFVEEVGRYCSMQ